MKNLGILDFIEVIKKQGRVLHFGFSFHGDKKEFKAIINDYSWDLLKASVKRLAMWNDIRTMKMSERGTGIKNTGRSFRHMN